MKRTDRKLSLTGWILAAVLLVYLGAICMVNFFAPPAFYDSDMYTDIRYAMEAW